MLLIVAHHYVVNSGLISEGGPLTKDTTSSNSYFLMLYGAWGKIGINCFLMITGYFMCTSNITLRKLLKLFAQIYLYRWILYPIFLLAGYETFSGGRVIRLLMPVWGFGNNFTSCFIGFWLMIPFFNILVQNMTKHQHKLLLLLILIMYTFLGSIPDFNVNFNYVTWFGIIYFLASYIRLYPNRLFENRQLWCFFTFFSIVLALVSVFVMQMLYGSKDICASYFFVSDCNKILAVAVALCTFLWFKNIKIKCNKVINAFGSGTFGVLLLHTNSDAMRTWLWNDVVDVVGHYQSMSLYYLVLYSFTAVLTIFVLCNLIDQLRISTLEKWLLRCYDNRISTKA